MKRRISALTFLIFFVVLSFVGCGRGKLYTQKKLLLGTVVEVTSPYPEAASIAFKEIERIEKIFSTYIINSAVSHLNETGFLNTNFEVAHLIEKAKIFHNLTEGKFDITIGPLTKLWKKAIEKERIPSQEDIGSALELLGFDQIQVDKFSHSVRLNKKGMYLDFGAIATGYAVDMAVKELRRNGIGSALIDAGGDIYCLGTKFGKLWRVGVQNPGNLKKLSSVLELKDSATATSGDYQQYFDYQGKRYSHIIDPKTGYPIESGVVSVTVTAKDTITADAVSTCVFLLGKEKGIEVFKNYEGVKEIFVVTKNELSNN